MRKLGGLSFVAAACLSLHVSVAFGQYAPAQVRVEPAKPQTRAPAIKPRPAKHAPPRYVYSSEGPHGGEAYIQQALPESVQGPHSASNVDRKALRAGEKKKSPKNAVSPDSLNRQMHLRDGFAGRGDGEANGTAAQRSGRASEASTFARDPGTTDKSTTVVAPGKETVKQNSQTQPDARFPFAIKWPWSVESGSQTPAEDASSRDGGKAAAASNERRLQPESLSGDTQNAVSGVQPNGPAPPVTPVVSSSLPPPPASRSTGEIEQDFHGRQTAPSDFREDGAERRTNNASLSESSPDANLPAKYERQIVAYDTNEHTGTIVVDTPHTFLYLILGHGKALRYGIGVGREGFTWSGTERIASMKEWPDWYPPREMIQRQPYLPRVMAGGPGNPLGARALYLGHTLYRIHGTNEPNTIGMTVSSGCIRLLNQDIEDLYRRVTLGTKVVVLPNSKPGIGSDAVSRGESSIDQIVYGSGG